MKEPLDHTQYILIFIHTPPDPVAHQGTEGKEKTGEETVDYYRQPK